MVMQPTELCNLNCSYCYLPNRKVASRMDVSIVDRIAEEIPKLNWPIQMIWHGGEPLAVGIEKFEALLSPFQSDQCKSLITHCIQTNAILINDAWIELFKKYNIRVGVSVDGDKVHNISRRFWNGKESFERTLSGIEKLSTSGVPFSTITVIPNKNLKQGTQILKFLRTLKPTMMGFNIEEQEGINVRGCDSGQLVTNFWRDIVAEWKKDSSIPVRELNYILPLLSLASNGKYHSDAKIIDIFPSISVNGDVVVLSPEFVNASSERYNDFVIGNIKKEFLHDILERAVYSKYVVDFLSGTSKCQAECEYFPFCGGGQASNKFFENNDLTSTETNYCLTTVKSLVDGVISFNQE